MNLGQIIKDITNRYSSLGYKTFPVNYKIIETFLYSDLAPMESDKDGKTIYIDTDAITDLNENSAYFYLGHELAHCFTNKNHGDKEFEGAIAKYNKHFSPKIVSDPDDKYNKKMLPNFSKKDEWLNNAKTEEQFKQDLKTKPWLNKSCFNY